MQSNPPSLKSLKKLIQVLDNALERKQKVIDDECAKLVQEQLRD